MRRYAYREFIEAPRCMTADKESHGVAHDRGLLSDSMIKLAKCMCLDLCCVQRFLCRVSNSNAAYPVAIGTTSIGFGKCFVMSWSLSRLFRARVGRAIGQKQWGKSLSR